MSSDLATLGEVEKTVRTKYFRSEFCSTSTDYWVTSQKDDITRRASEAACWLRLGCWSQGRISN